ncbi:MAG: putative repeat protein (TIGR01451 family) [Crocinitomicaceae bacterium]|jgi:uncharacterized repeat protein (TIGR01451 family)
MKLIITALLSSISFFGWSQAQYDLDWGAGFASPLDDYLNHVVITPQNSVLIVGVCGGGVDFDLGPGVMIPFTGNVSNYFVAEYDTAGGLNWIKYWDLPVSGDWHMAVDKLTGKISIVGMSSSDFDADPGPAISNLSISNESEFRIVLDPNGNFIEASRIAEEVGTMTTDIRTSHIAVDTAQSIYTTGFYKGAIDFNPGGTAVIDTGYVNGSIYLRKNDVNGDFLWSNFYGYGFGVDVYVDDSSNVFFCGTFYDTVDFDPGPGQDIHIVNGVNMRSSFLQKLDPNGNVIWTEIYDNEDVDVFSGIVVDSLGNVIVVGVSGIGLNGGRLMILKYDPLGTLIWEKAIGNINDFGQTHGLVLDSLNNIYVSGAFVGVVDMDPDPIGVFYANSGSNIYGANFVLKLAEDGTFIWENHVGASYHAPPRTDLIAVDNDGNIFLGANYETSEDIDPGSGTTTVTPSMLADFYFLRLNPNECAHFYASMDSVQNGGCFTPGYAEATAYNGTGSIVYSWNNTPPSDSSSAVITDAGIYTMTVTDSVGCVFESSIVISMPTTYTGFDLNANLIATSLFPGEPVYLWLDAFNDGCILQGGTVSLVFQDTLIENLTFNPIPDAVNGDTVVWNYAPAIYDDPHFIVEIAGTVNTLAQAWDIADVDVIFLPSVGDFDVLNNYKEYDFEVFNSYDPNFKSVNPTGVCPEHFVLKDQTLTYTVHFQNTGTASAINISILDELDADLDINSLRVVSQSHPMIMDVLPSNTIDFKFDAINLPDSSSNQLASHGWVVFEIDPLPNLSDGTEIINSVGIYFDYNPPIVTNTVHITYVDVIDCSLGLFPLNEMEVHVYPNPTTGIITIELAQASESVSLTVMSIDGRVVSSASYLSGSEFQVNLLGQKNGVYWLVVESGKSKATYKVILL